MRKLFIAFLVILLPSISNAQKITGYENNIITVFENQIVATTDSVASALINIGNAKIFSAYVDLDSTTNWTADKPNIKVKYALTPFFDGTETYVKVGETAPITIATFTATDTLNGGRRYFSFHTSSAVAPSLARRIQIFLVGTATNGTAPIIKKLVLLKQP